ncbi:MAG: hypothetical protein RLZZ369_1906 [Pseudomonadota bacterium]|jgi:putative membrane protein insertion efficiency factor
MKAVMSAVVGWLSRAINAVLMGVVKAYRFFLSPWLGSACRFTPTCSQYALQALDRHGPAAGSYLAARRLLRCHPACAGGHDPVPEQAPRLFSFSKPSSDSPRS